jgi:hypothetical protein
MLSSTNVENDASAVTTASAVATAVATPSLPHDVDVCTADSASAHAVAVTAYAMMYDKTTNHETFQSFKEYDCHYDKVLPVSELSIRFDAHEVSVSNDDDHEGGDGNNKREEPNKQTLSPNPPFKHIEYLTDGRMRGDDGDDESYNEGSGGHTHTRAHTLMDVPLQMRTDVNIHRSHCIHFHCTATTPSSLSKMDKRGTFSFHTQRTRIRPGQDRVDFTPPFSPSIIKMMCIYQQGAENSVSSPTIAPSHRPLLDKVDGALLHPPSPGTTSVIVGVATANVRSSNQIQLTALLPSMTDVTIVFSL